MKLTYYKPASEWVEALPIGNGRLGAMVYGGTDRETIQLNEETLWSGYYDAEADNPECAERLEEIRRAVFGGNYAEGERLTQKYMICRGKGSSANRDGAYGSYETAGELYLDFDYGKKQTVISDYLRTLDLDTGLVSVTYRANGVSRRRYTFSSFVRNVTVSYMESDEPCDVKLTFAREDASVRYTDKEIIVKGVFTKGAAYATVIRIESNGKAVADETGLYVRHTSELTLYIDTQTTYVAPMLNKGGTLDEKTVPQRNPEIPFAAAKEKTEQLLSADPRDLQRESGEVISAMMNRVKFRLDRANGDFESLPTDERITGLKNGNRDTQLILLYFDFGRYLLISSSYRCKLPANLQGLWAASYRTIWSADYHININLQMNYWPAELCGLPELTEPFIRYIRFLSVHGKRTAAIQYHASGWCAHTVTNPWGFTAPGEGASWGSFMCAGAWCCYHIWERYRFSGERSVLAENYDILRGACEFFLDFLVTDPATGYLVTCPSNSPENRFIAPATGEPIAICAGPTMDIEIISGLFERTANAADILGVDEAFAAKLRETAAKLPPLRIGRYGQIMEWNEDFEEAERAHRHISHLFALHPGNAITKNTPELFEAAKVVLRRRLEAGGGHTGWSRAWIINFYARLGMGDECLKHLTDLIARCTLPNMFDTHPPFQIDGNFGGVSGIAEMLIASHDGGITLLPALPSDEDWADGSVCGLCARGGYTADITWRNFKVTQFRLTALHDSAVSVTANGITREYTLKKGSPIIVNP